ncbi:uncharacterized protein F4812DRAFT_454142 [Daldinia caldariorum]|uniref:uncharacterized protein n=1 Tax=Daldinia caldariorum TaxID=326644 RepID=UPI002007E49D|nr:uncharacterized protein F4812DRAFT_454142 [Daldinia caldariorum]KAI1472327.1 hypothetical protein F4812DRAFT_454142 [Daldinia caldariorum]
MAGNGWKSHGRIASEPAGNKSRSGHKLGEIILSPTKLASYWARRYFRDSGPPTREPEPPTRNPLIPNQPSFLPRPGTRITVAPSFSAQHSESDTSPTHRSSSAPPRWPSPWNDIPIGSSAVIKPGSTASLDDYSASYCVVRTNSLYSGSKKSLNVESPSFTPTQLGGKKSNFSTNATPFTPRGASTSTSSTLQQDAGASLYKSAPFPDFAPQNYDLNTATATNGSADGGPLGYDPFTMPSVSQALPSAQYNPYADDHNALAGAGAPYFAAQNSYTTPSQPLQYHLYYPITTGRENMQPYQRQVHDLFLPESLREDLQKRSEATRQVLPSQPGVQLPNLQHYHSLVPLDTKLRSTTSTFGLPSWVFKATSRKNGNTFCLRRIEGFRLTNEEAIKAVNSWKKIIHPNIVTTFEAFTTRDFNDSSLVFVHSYHPLSKTLAEHHFATNRFGRPPAPVPERTLWTYLVQLASALKAIHKAKLAARCIDINKVILTEKNRVRLGACSILDVLHFEAPRRIEELQQEDFYSLGRLILSIATNTPPRNLTDPRPALEQLGRVYSPELKERISWLLSTPQNVATKTAEHLVYDIAQHMDDILVASFNTQDEVTAHLGRELENGRLVRLMAKLGSINERPEFDNDPNWAETSERYTLKLFRDYVFHQVDAQGNPVVDLGHIISCLNKLDAGIDERIYLTSRDHQSTFVVSYKELKKQVQSAFSDLLKGANKAQANRY